MSNMSSSSPYIVACYVSGHRETKCPKLAGNFLLGCVIIMNRKWSGISNSVVQISINKNNNFEFNHQGISSSRLLAKTGLKCYNCLIFVRFWFLSDIFR